MQANNPFFMEPVVKNTDVNNSPVGGEEVENISEFVTGSPVYQPSDLLTDPETTSLLRLAPGTMALWRHKCRGPAYIKIGRSVRYKYSDILEYLANQRITP